MCAAALLSSSEVINTKGEKKSWRILTVWRVDFSGGIRDSDPSVLISPEKVYVLCSVTLSCVSCLSCAAGQVFVLSRWAAALLPHSDSELRRFVHLTDYYESKKKKLFLNVKSEQKNSKWIESFEDPSSFLSGCFNWVSEQERRSHTSLKNKESKQTRQILWLPWHSLLSLGLLFNACTLQVYGKNKMKLK